MDQQRRFKGIWYHRPSGRYRAVLRRSPGKYINLGYFYSEERAIKALESHTNELLSNRSSRAIVEG